MDIKQREKVYELVHNVKLKKDDNKCDKKYNSREVLSQAEIDELLKILNKPVDKPKKKFGTDIFSCASFETENDVLRIIKNNYKDIIEEYPHLDFELGYTLSLFNTILLELEYYRDKTKLLEETILYQLEEKKETKEKK